MNASLAVARFELATRDPAAAHQRLLALEAQSEGYQHEILKLKCLTLLIACQFALGDHAASMQRLRRLSSRIIPFGLKRVIADEKSFIQPAFEYALDKTERTGTAAYVNAQIILEEWLNAQRRESATSANGRSRVVGAAGWAAGRSVTSTTRGARIAGGGLVR